MSVIARCTRKTSPTILAFVLSGYGMFSVLIASQFLYGDLYSILPVTAVSATLYTPRDFQQEHTARHSVSRAVDSAPEFDWQKVKPSPVLSWVKCYTGNECARLEVPLDYADPEGNQVAIALLRFRANVSAQSPEYRGPVLFNPGGPGESGVEFIRSLGKSYQQVLGNGYDIIGFDPRGIGATTPAVSIFADQVERAYWDAGTPPLPNSTADALSQGFSRALLFNELIEARNKRAVQYAGTALVARDMLTITRAHGRERLQYWGFSYGTVLGATYAAMFPDNVERLIIDGVADFDDYYAGSWSKNLLQTDGVLQYLYDQCAKAGTACPLHADTGALVKQRVDSIFAKIKANPLPVINGTNYGLVDYSVLQTELFVSLYHPFAEFPPLAQGLVALENGNGWPILETWKAIRSMPKCDTPPVPTDGKEGMVTVICSEAEGARNDLPDLIEHLKEQRKISAFADIWTDTTRTPCAGWKIPTKERFSGALAANTSFPLLIIGNTKDPVTPIVGAQKAARSFGGSVLLTIDTPGHTSVASTSTCANKIIRSYFLDGKLPQEGTVCGIEDVLFGAAPKIRQEMTVEDIELLEVSRSLSSGSHSFRSSRGSPLL